MPPLKNTRHERYCLLRAGGLTIDEAYEKAGFTANRGNAGRLNANEDVAKRIRELQEGAAKSAGVTIERVARGFFAIADVDIAKCYDKNGNLLPIHEIPKSVRRAIASIEVDEIYEGTGRERFVIGHTKKVKFWSKIDAWTALGRHVGFFTKDNERKMKVTLEDLVAGSGEDEGEKE
jgi:phage terminase small subunit